MTSTQWNSSSNYIKRQLIRLTSKCRGVVACPVCCIPLTPHTVDPLLLITISNRNDIEQCGSDNRRLYRLLNGRLQRRKSPCLPANDNATYSVYTHCRYVLSLHSLALRTQSTVTGATYSVYTHWRYALSLQSLALRTQSTLTGATYSVYSHWRYVLSLHLLALRTQSTLTGATYSVNTHWRYVLSLHSLALRTQSTLTGATYSVYTYWRYVLSLHSLALRTQSTLTGATYSVYTHWRYVLSQHSLALRTQSTRTQSTVAGATYSVYTHLHHDHRPPLNTLRVTTSLTSGCNIRHPQPAQQVANNIVRARSLTNMAAERSPIASSFVPRCLKHPKFIPVLKKANLDHNNMNYYRPISNLHFVSKLLE